MIFSFANVPLGLLQKSQWVVYKSPNRTFLSSNKRLNEEITSKETVLVMFFKTSLSR
jgi:hypothetical protein